MYPTRHTGPPNNPQPPQPAPNQFSSGLMTVVNESCDKIRKEFEALQAANHSLRMELEKVHNDKADLHRHFIMYYDMSYALHLDICKQKEIAKRLNTIIIKILPLLTSDHHAQIASSVDQANQVSPEDMNRILDQQLREGYGSGDLHAAAAAGMSAGAGGAAGLPGLPRPLPGTPGMPGSVHGLPPHGPPLHLQHSMPPHSLAPPHGPPMHGLPPQALLQPPLNISSPPNPAGLLAMSGGPGLPGIGPGGLLAGIPGGPIPPHLLPKDPNQPPPPSSRNNQIPIDNNNSLSNQHQQNNNSNNNNSNSTFNHNKPPRNSIDGERRTASSSSVTSDRDHRDSHNISQLNDSKLQTSSKKPKRNDDPSSAASMAHNQHQVMLNNSSSVSDDEKSEDLVVDGNDDRVPSPGSHHNGGSTSPKENGGGSLDWSQKNVKKERPLSRASSVTSGCGPSGRERVSPKTSSSLKTKSSPNTTQGAMTDSLGPLGPGMPNQMLPGLGGYGRPMFPMGPVGPDGMPVGAPRTGGVRMPFAPTSEPYSIQLDSEGNPRLIPCSPRVLSDSSVPKKAREVFSLDHGEVVCAVALSNPTKNIYTGGKGFVKVWSLDNSESNNEMRAFKTIHNPVAELACLPPDSYVRSCKLLPDGKKLIVGGEVPPISVWDLNCATPVKIGELKELATACYALAISPDSRTCITCFSDGTIGLYDVHNLQLIGKFQGHGDGASCIDISSDGNTLWTGGLDTTVKSWNLNLNSIVGERDFVTKTNFNSQIFSLGCCPSGDYIAVGMENSIIEVLSTNNRSEKIQLKIHDSCVLALKFAASGKWFISTGKDKLLNLCGSPALNCPLIMKSTENSSVLSCDISSDDKYFATGSGEKKATVYEVLY